MIGVILAGGEGKRLRSISKGKHKSLVEVAGRPMLTYPFETLLQSGIEDIVVVGNKPNIPTFRRILEDRYIGRANIQFAIQESSLGTADSLKTALHYTQGENIFVIYGDIVVDGGFAEQVQQFKEGALVFLRHVEDPRRYGVYETQGEYVTRIEEKPEQPRSNLVFTGLSMYDQNIEHKFEGLQLSPRGELELTDVMKRYIPNQELKSMMLKNKWFDAGTPESWNEANQYFLRK